MRKTPLTVPLSIVGGRERERTGAEVTKVRAGAARERRTTRSWWGYSSDLSEMKPSISIDLPGWCTLKNRDNDEVGSDDKVRQSLARV